MNDGVKYMLVSVSGFALMQLCVKYLVHIPAAELVLFRSFISVVLSGAMIWKEGISPFGNNKKYLFLRGLFGTIALALYFYTLQKLPISTAAVLQYLSPIFTAFFAIWMLKEPMRVSRWFFFLISIVGVVIVKGFSPDLTMYYMIIGVASAVFAGLAYNCVRILRKTDKPVVIVLYFPLVAIPIMALLSIPNWMWPQGTDWLFIGAMGIFTQLGQIYMTKALHAEKAGVTTSMKYLGIFYALSFDYFLFGVSFELMTLFGIGLVLLGVMLNVIRKD